MNRLIKGYDTRPLKKAVVLLLGSSGISLLCAIITLLALLTALDN